MKPTVIFAVLICQLANAQTNFFPLLCCSNRTYTNATIESVTPATVTIFWDGGGERIPFTNLPPELLTRYHYDPAKAAQFLEEGNQKKKALATAKEAAQQAAGEQAVIREFENTFSTKYDPIRQNGISWNSIERLNPASFIHVGFFAAVEQNDVKFWTNSTGLHYQVRRKPESVSMIIDRHYSSPINDFIIVYDGKRKNFGNLEPHDNTAADVITESFYPNFTYAEFRNLSLAQSVKAVLGASDFELSYKDRAAMRVFVNYFDRACADSH